MIPGISAGVGGLAHAGIPLTHRETNSAVTFITGHGASGDIPDGIDWPALAAGSPVLVIYMAIKHLAIIRQRLFDGGRHRDEAVAVVSNATLAEEVVLETTLGRCVEDVASSNIEPPAMVVVGESCACARSRLGGHWVASYWPPIRWGRAAPAKPDKFCSIAPAHCPLSHPQDHPYGWPGGA